MIVSPSMQTILGRIVDLLRDRLDQAVLSSALSREGHRPGQRSWSAHQGYLMTIKINL